MDSQYPRKKFQFGQEIKFAGFVVSPEGVKPDPGKVEAISEFPVPQDITELRSFLGLVQQLGSFIPDLSNTKEPLRGLLKKNVVYQWLEDHQTAFAQTKSILTSDLLVQYFDTNLRTELLTDDSRLKGIGFALIQRDSNDRIRLIQCGSRSLSKTETNYAVCELEALAIKYAIERCSFYLRGCPQFDVLTDHRPLVGIFDNLSPSTHQASSDRVLVCNQVDTRENSPDRRCSLKSSRLLARRRGGRHQSHLQ